MGDASSSLQGAMCGLVDVDPATPTNAPAKACAVLRPTTRTPRTFAPTKDDMRPEVVALAKGEQDAFALTKEDMFFIMGARGAARDAAAKGSGSDLSTSASDLFSKRAHGAVKATKGSGSDVSTSASDDGEESCASSSSSVVPDYEESLRKFEAPVRLHVYDLGKKAAAVNRVSKEMGLGAFHTGVEVYGREWCFGTGNGICYVKPGKDPCHQFRETIEMGTTSLSPKQLTEMIARLQREWTGESYRLLTRNCHHFSEALLKELGAEEIPKWCNSLAGKPVGFANWFLSSDTDFDGGSAVWQAFGLASDGSPQNAPRRGRRASSQGRGVQGAAR